MSPAPRTTKATESAGQRRRREQLQVQIGARIAELRRERGWTQVELAGRLKVNMRHLQNTELGKSNLTLGSLARIAHALRVGVAALFEEPLPRIVRSGRPKSSD